MVARLLTCAPHGSASGDRFNFCIIRSQLSRKDPDTALERWLNLRMWWKTLMINIKGCGYSPDCDVYAETYENKPRCYSVQLENLVF